MIMADVFAVFEGGGVKGIAHVGALARFHEVKDLQFKGYAGTWFKDYGNTVVSG
jgi:predicted acylesterase/phospholipase RssA